MSIALERSSTTNNNEFLHLGIRHLPIYKTEEDVEEERLDDGVEGEEEEEENSCSSSSSIGKNSDVLFEEEEDGSEEVESSYKGGEEGESSFDCLDALEEVLPIRRGISMFYNGKSKSFASLTEASAVSTIKEVAKPDNAYAKKRRNILASSSHVWNRNFPLKGNGGGISKKQGSFPLSRSTLAMAVAMNSSSSDSNASSEDSGSPPPQLPPLPPGNRRSCNRFSTAAASPGKSFSPWRSYSVADMQHCASVCYSSVLDTTEES